MTQPDEKTFEQRIREQYEADRASKIFSGHAVIAMDELLAELASLKAQLAAAEKERDEAERLANDMHLCLEENGCDMAQLTAATARADATERTLERMTKGIARIKQMTVDTDRDDLPTSWVYDQMQALLASQPEGANSTPSRITQLEQGIKKIIHLAPQPGITMPWVLENLKALVGEGGSDGK